jgi:hypothetical protein
LYITLALRFSLYNFPKSNLPSGIDKAATAAVPPHSAFLEKQCYIYTPTHQRTHVEAAYTSETSATSPTTTRCNNPRTEVTFNEVLLWFSGVPRYTYWYIITNLYTADGGSVLHRNDSNDLPVYTQCHNTIDHNMKLHVLEKFKSHRSAYTFRRSAYTFRRSALKTSRTSESIYAPPSPPYIFMT